MPWRFVDRQGHEGWIGEDLSVDYAGEEGIAQLVERLAGEVDAESTRDLPQRVVIELYTTGAVRIVERYPDGATDCRPRPSMGGGSIHAGGRL
ncbi:hypothetical protein ACFQE8_02140 [Salinirubellus sp. GCM10025818]|uniref:hypothetical protein n=1 Tax=Salinirubellus TaxID=2162630 RepID=UPI0030D47330